MGTRAIIAIPVEKVESSTFALNDYFYDEKEFDSISLSMDGYPSNVYQKLKELIKNYDVKIILANGNMSTIGSKYEPNELGFHSSHYPQNDVCVVLSRDTPNIDKQKVEMKTLKKRTMKETYQYHDYLYVINDDKIFCSPYFNEVDLIELNDDNYEDF